MHSFKATIHIIGINPYVSVPDKILQAIFEKAGKDKGPVPVRGSINKKPYKQTLMKYAGAWRLYINTTMLKDSPKRIGETVELTIEFDPSDRSIAPHPDLVKALKKDKKASEVFESLSPSRKHEIVRYIASLKSEESVRKNIERAINFLNGKGKFVGRDNP